MSDSKELPYGDQVNYWKTGQSSADSWTEKTCKVIESFGGVIISESYGRDAISKRSAFMINFRIEGEEFRVVWPVLPVRNSRDEGAARRQAATLLYHDCKTKTIKAAIFGAKVAFHDCLVLPDGRMASQLSSNEVMKMLPNI